MLHRKAFQAVSLRSMFLLLNAIILFSQFHLTRASPDPTSSSFIAYPSGSEIQCTRDEGDTYTTGGQTFQLVCGQDEQGHDVMTVTDVLSYEDCADKCASNIDCVFFLWVSPAPNNCYLKSAYEGATDGDPSLWGGYLIPPQSAGSTSSSGSVSTSASSDSSSSSSSSGPTGSSSDSASSSGSVSTTFSSDSSSSSTSVPSGTTSSVSSQNSDGACGMPSGQDCSTFGPDSCCSSFGFW
jgi:hypothetical protein